MNRVQDPSRVQARAAEDAGVVGPKTGLETRLQHVSKVHPENMSQAKLQHRSKGHPGGRAADRHTCDIAEARNGGWGLTLGTGGPRFMGTRCLGEG